MNNEIHFESETEMVNHAIDLYFSNVPERPYWLLIAFYLAAKKELQIVDGEVDPNILKLAQIDIWVNENSIKEESLEGTYYYGGELVTRNICSVYRDNELNFIINEFERAIFNEVTIFQSPQICEKKSKYIQNLYSVATILIGLSEEWFREEGSSTFDLILEKTISSFKDVLGNQIWLPKELSSLLANLLNYKNDGTIYNPFTNYCDISSILGKEALVYSVTNNPLVNALSLLRNYVRGNKNTRVRKFFNNSWHYLGQTDYLVACPPFGLKDEKGGEIAANFISNAIDSVNNTSVFVVTQGFLNSSSRYCIEVRKKLVESKAIETIINLPSNLLESTSTPLAILVLKKDRRNVGTEIFRFIDATNCCFKQNKKNLLDEFSVESLYDMSIVDPDYDRIIEFDKVDKSDYCLSMSYYLYKEGQDHRFAQCLVSLSRLGTFLNLPSFDYDIENINVVKIKDLSSSEDFQLEKNSKDFGIFEDNKREDYKVLSEDAVLISRFGTVKAVSYISNGDTLSSSRRDTVGFDGELAISIYDKAQLITTKDNDEPDPTKRDYYTYEDYPNILFSGNVQVQNGLFTITFRMPKDIRYNTGAGRITMYAIGYTDSRQVEALGHNEQFMVGGSSPIVIDDNQGPEIHMYLNTPLFSSGDKVNTTPHFFAELYDENGINTVGSGIGHDLQLMIDNSKKQTYILNNYYTAESNSYQRGTVSYILPELSNGDHTLTFRAWDMLNNASTQSFGFSVDNDAGPSVKSLVVYPNPVSQFGTLNMYISHDRPDDLMSIEIVFYNIVGQKIWSTYRSLYDTTISLDMTEAALPVGTYIYQFTIQTSTQSSINHSGRIIVY